MIANNPLNPGLSHVQEPPENRSNHLVYRRQSPDERAHAVSRQAPDRYQCAACRVVVTDLGSVAAHVAGNQYDRRYLG